MPSPEKFRETLDTFKVDEAIIKEMYEGFGELVSKTSKKIKSAFFKQALDVMNARLPQKSVQEIVESNACCKSGSRLKASKDFAAKQSGLSIEERLKLISARPYMNMGRAEFDGNGDLIVYAVNAYSDGKFECVCPTISKVKRDYKMPREYCYCCGGHFKFHYEIMLGVKLELAEIVSSPHDNDGKESCVFCFRILPEA